MLPIAIIGAGPVGLAAAAHLVERGLTPLILEAGPRPALLSSMLQPLLDELNPAHRQALQLTELGGLTQREAAAEAGVSTTAMKTRVRRGKTALGRVLDACCTFEQDARGTLQGFTSRDDGCGACPCL